MILVPDIHGRDFWKKIRDKVTEEKIIFLGDYTDSYPQEKITNQQTLENFKEIIEFKKNNEKNVVLLIGNHDQHYFIQNSCKSSRYSYELASQYFNLFNENRDIFSICYDFKLLDKWIIISHAGILKGWKNHCFTKVSDENICDYLNNAYLVEDPKLGIYLSDISFYRWGDSQYGSCTWADFREHVKEHKHICDFQIFGHTQLIEGNPFFDKHCACIDIRRPFILDEEGNFKEIDGTIIKNILKGDEKIENNVI